MDSTLPLGLRAFNEDVSSCVSVFLSAGESESQPKPLVVSGPRQRGDEAVVSGPGSGPAKIPRVA